MVVFLGPSLDREIAENCLKADFRGPVRMGDIYSLLGTEIRQILIIDGVFHGAHSVWHREILAAIRSGILVAGASSMGALRAVELERYGMFGVGRVFTAYRDGEIDADDEVVLRHGDEESGYRAMSVPLVNIRFTLEEAKRRGLIDGSACAQLLECAKSCYYPGRNYQLLLDSPVAQTWPKKQHTRFREFVETEAIDQKAEDAKELLELAASEKLVIKSCEALKTKDYHYAPTEIGSRLLKRRDGTKEKAANLLTSICKDTVHFRKLWSKINPILFLSLWADEQSFTPTETELRELEKRLFGEIMEGPYPSVSLTVGEFSEALRRRVIAEWIVSNDPSKIGRSFPHHKTFIDGWTAWNLKNSTRSVRANHDAHASVELMRRRLVEVALQAEWATTRGIRVSEEDIVAVISRWEKSWEISDRRSFLEACGLTESQYGELHRQRSLAAFLTAKGPHFFGVQRFCYELEILVELALRAESEDVFEGFLDPG